jgi:putative ABC transport system ATP-binding protein
MMIELRDVGKVFNSGKPSEYVAVRGVDLDVSAHELTVLKGPSGSGKTTLLSILGCMARPTNGRIMLGCREITSLPERFLAEIRRNTFGFIFQRFNLIKGISVIENVMIPAYPGGEKRAPLVQRALALLDTFNLGPKAEAKIEWLSGGEAQRVAIARALINNPSVIIADEPTAHLDTKLSREFMETMLTLKEGEKTLLIASHDPIVYDSGIVDRVIEMRDGMVIDTGTAS